MRYDPTKQHGCRREGFERVIFVVRILVEYAVNHAGKNVLIQGIPRPLIPAENFDHVTDLYLATVHFLVMLLHFADRCWRHAVVFSLVGVDNVVEALPVIYQSWIGRDTQ